MDGERMADAQGVDLTGGQATSGTLTDGGSTLLDQSATDIQRHGAAKGCGPVAPGTGDAAAGGAAGENCSAAAMQAGKHGRDAHATGGGGRDGRGTELPEWQKISGLAPEAEGKMSRSERRLALRKLFRHYENLVREALAEHERETVEEKSERTFLWEPLTGICVELGIARRKLSAPTRELTGMAAHEVIDKVRAESLPEKMEANLAALFKTKLVPGSTRNAYTLGLWNELKKWRQNPAFEFSSLAQEYGFANYARLRRGCMLANGGVTPRQMEFAVLEKFREWYTVVEALSARRSSMGESNWVWISHNEGKPWNDAWSAALQARPQWVAQMREKLGVRASLEEYAALEIVPAHKDARIREACERNRAMTAESLRKEEEAKRKSEERPAQDSV